MSRKQYPHWVYIAGKVRDDNSSIQDVISQFVQAGYEITYDWTRSDGIQKPYLEHATKNRPAAEDMRHGVQLCEVFVLLCGGDIFGAMAEFGMALAAPPANSFRQRKLYVVGEPVQLRQSIFFTLPEVKVCSTVEEVLADLGR